MLLAVSLKQEIAADHYVAAELHRTRPLISTAVPGLPGIQLVQRAVHSFLLHGLTALVFVGF